jgi:hypothetical protein
VLDPGRGGFEHLRDRHGKPHRQNGVPMDGFHEDPHRSLYFVAYMTTDGQAGVGNCEVRLPHAIRNSDDVRVVTRLIEESNGLSGVIVTNFRRFDTD